MDYISLYLKFVTSTNQKDFDDLYLSRFNSESSYHFPIIINGNEAFFYYHGAIAEKLNKIYRLDKEVEDAFSKLPGVAQEHYIKKSLIDEVEMTNQIEGVISTRKELDLLIDDIKEKITHRNRFEGIVNKYYKLMKNEKVSLDTAQDLRKLYDEILLHEVIADNPQNNPDGDIFRKEIVHVQRNVKSIHDGVYPESKIIEYVDSSLHILNSKEIDPILSACIFHYLIGYIHPFYDGNGRLARFITSYVFSKCLTPISGYRISMAIKENISDYYTAFKYTNDVRNKGDIGTFVNVFLDIMIKSFEQTIIYAKNKKMDLDQKEKLLFEKVKGLKVKEKNIAYYLLQSQLFSKTGLRITDIVKIGGGGADKTVRKIIDNFERKNIAIKNRIGRNYYYTLNLNVLGNE